jgi:hypothetical protein
MTRKGAARKLSKSDGYAVYSASQGDYGWREGYFGGGFPGGEVICRHFSSTACSYRHYNEIQC